MRSLLTLAVLFPSTIVSAAEADSSRPNIVYIMSDELAYYELSHMGNSKIHTPNIDRMAEQGLRFTSALAGAPVCAPLRCTLMTGKHMGHASVRANDGGTPLRAGEPTIASMLKPLGYATGGFGKWGAGGRGSTGVPEKHGFDEFFGYYDQVHAHSFYPPYLVRNSEEVPLAGNIGGRSGETYSHYVIMDQAESFIRKNKDRPFFCYLPITPPHGMYDIPASDPAWQQYTEDHWVQDETIPQDVKNYAAMVTMVDNDLGRITNLLQELGLEKNTIVFFTGDNGGQDRFRNEKYPRGFFGPNKDPRTGVEFRGGKGNLYEGGLRIPFLVRWPGRIKPNQTSDLIFYQPDMMATLGELVGAKVPDDTDGISILPTILGPSAVGHAQEHREMLYWEIGNQVAVRFGKWKAIRPRPAASWELYDLDKDISETENIASDHKETLAAMTRFAEAEHTPVEPGTFVDRIAHERDRAAKWGTSQRPTGSGKANKLSGKNLIPAASMKIVRVSSENLPNGKRAIAAIDGNPHTLWHSQFSDGVKKHPHEIVLDLGTTYQVTGFRYLPRQDGGWNGAFGRTEFYVSDEVDHFDQPSAKVTFGKVRKMQSADCSGPVAGRYVLVRILSEVNGNAWASAAEIGVIGTK